jgi:protein required for attachment to host cells
MKLWILICDASRARVFTAPCTGGPLLETEGFVHPKSRLKGADIMTDRPGRVRTGLGGKSATAMPPQTDPKDVAAADFAAELVRVLERAREQGEFELLALVAPPRFLGLVRAGLDEQTRRRVVACLPKELTLLAALELPPHLSEVFDAAARAELAAEAAR